MGLLFSQSQGSWWRERWRTDRVRDLLKSGTTDGECLNTYSVRDSLVIFADSVAQSDIFCLGLWDVLGPLVRCKVSEESESVLNCMESGSYDHRDIHRFTHKLGYKQRVYPVQKDLHWWIQLAFSLLYKEGLIYRADRWVHWCDTCRTARSDEEIVDGACLCCHQQVVEREMPQWFLGTTRFAEKALTRVLQQELDLDWISLLLQWTENMRDQLISCQELWRVPIPVVHCEECGETLVPVDKLPVRMSVVSLQEEQVGGARFESVSVPSFVRTRCPVCMGTAVRETDTLSPIATWYLVRFVNVVHNQEAFNRSAVGYFLPTTLLEEPRQAIISLLYTYVWDAIVEELEL